MQACSLCASLPRTQSLERESARILQAGSASPGRAGRGEVLNVRAKMRGVLRGDLQVSVDDGMLVVEARVHEPARDSAAAGRTYWHKFHVCLVGEEVDECGIRATFRDSVLEVKIPLQGEQARLVSRGRPNVPTSQRGPPSAALSLAGFVHLFLR